MILFRFLHLTIGLAMRTWFRKVYYTFEAPIPEGVPVIFASTHPNSAIDYLFAPIITSKPVFVLVRSDVFKKGWLNRLFRSIWMIPIYRIRDGFGNLSLNDQSFSECYDVFRKNGRVLIFSEGVCVQKKEIQPLKKGTARLAIDYLEKGGGQEILIVPMANNYTAFRTFRSTVMTNFGTPLRGSDYKELYAENPNRAYQKLTEDIANSLQNLFLTVPEYSDHCFTEKALMTMRTQRRDERPAWLVNDPTPYLEERSLVTVLHGSISPPALNNLRAYMNQIQPTHSDEGTLAMSVNPWQRIGLLLGLAPIISLSQLALYFPWKTASWLVNHKIRDIIFHDTVMILGSLVIGLVQSAILYIILMIIMGWNGLVVASAIVSLLVIYPHIIDDYLLSRYVISKERRARLKEAVSALNELTEKQ